MGCKTYRIPGLYGDGSFDEDGDYKVDYMDYLMYIPEIYPDESKNNDFGCLCTFGINRNSPEQMTPNTIRALASLGAAVAMANNDSLGGKVAWHKNPEDPEPVGEIYVNLRNLPEWVKEGIDNQLKTMENDIE